MPKRQEPLKLSRNKCAFCESAIDDPSRLGQFFKLEKLAVHYFCALFASGLAQNGPETDDFGFLEEDIVNEVRRARKLKCSYCRKYGAPIGCSVKKCNKCYHFMCGIGRGALHQYFGHFLSFCCEHKPRQPISENMKSRTDCGICLCPLELDNSDTYLYTPCCSNGWFHRACLQNFAHSAGYFFKCPFCNNRDRFREQMLLYGIYIPDQDASWERVENAFQELLERPQCGADVCLNPCGRKNNRKYTIWEIFSCSCCGGVGRHLKCAGLSRNKSWKCPDCVEMEQVVLKRVGSKHKEKNTKAKQVKEKTRLSSSCTRVLRSRKNDNNSVNCETIEKERIEDLQSENGICEVDAVKISYDSAEDELVDVTSFGVAKASEEHDGGKLVEDVVEVGSDKVMSTSEDCHNEEWSVVHYSRSCEDIVELFGEPSTSSIADSSSSDSSSSDSGVDYHMYSSTSCYSEESDGSRKENIYSSGVLFHSSEEDEVDCNSPKLRPTVINLKEEVVEPTELHTDDSNNKCSTHLADISLEVLSKANEQENVHSTGQDSIKDSHSKKFTLQASLASYLKSQKLIPSEGGAEIKKSLKRSAAQPVKPFKQRKKSQEMLIGRLQTLYDMQCVVKKQK